jgi:hypothetical protein
MSIHAHSDTSDKIQNSYVIAHHFTSDGALFRESWWAIPNVVAPRLASEKIRISGVCDVGAEAGLWRTRI